MSYGRFGRRTEAGQGGKLGHGRMSHYDYTEIVKEFNRVQRRRQDRSSVTDQLRSWGLR